MLKSASNRRRFLTLATVTLLAGCQVIPKGPPAPPPPPPGPDAGRLPTDTQRHRVALLVPLGGPNGAVGQSIANAATMALLDTNAQNLRITTYDTAAGVAGAATQAIADGNRLILGPLLSDDIPAVSAAARRARVPVISFSNDTAAAGSNVFIMGSVPGESITRTVDFARTRGVGRYAALVPSGEYGERASAALFASVRAAGGSVVATETYDRTNPSIVSAARRLRAKGGYDAVLIADGGRFAAQAAGQLKPAGAQGPRLLGTELWSGESVVASTPALRGAWFSAVSDMRFRQFSTSYKTRFGTQPYRIATLGYDAVLLTLRIGRDWRTGSAFPLARLLDDGGFIGLDGAFRFRSDGVIERALEVREVQAGGVVTVSPAPARFGE
ncbi:MAG: penicillin-binding protein activator [Novosphingobium sp.]